MRHACTEQQSIELQQQTQRRQYEAPVGTYLAAPEEGSIESAMPAKIEVDFAEAAQVGPDTVSQDRRRPVVTALIKLATSDDYQDRADAGRALANFADTAESRESLLRLVLDVHDMFVTLETAEALLRRQDSAGFAIVAEALVSADFQHHAYIHQAVMAVFMVFASERDRAMEACDALSRDASAQVRLGAVDLREMLAQISPVLCPEQPA
jgi:hypothetical protein